MTMTLQRQACVTRHSGAMQAQSATMQWISWQHTTPSGLTLRGWHTPPSGKPLVHFLHGNGFCGRMYEPMLAHLAHTHDLWLCDVQGHGDSDHGGPFEGWNANARHAMAALQAQGQAFASAPKLAVGHSFGGVLTSLMLAEAPTLFDRAVLLDPVLFTPTMQMAMSMAELTGMNRHSPLARQARARRHTWPSRQAARDNLQGRGVYKGWAPEALDAFLQHALKDANDGTVQLKCQPSREAEIFSSSPERLWNHLGRVRTPTLVLYAQHTFPFVTESVRRWADTNPSVQAQQVPGGHCFMQEAPADTAQRMLPFLLGAAG
jgi:pimeloyl-ACP methyl ester carboxylesterase